MPGSFATLWGPVLSSEQRLLRVLLFVPLVAVINVRISGAERRTNGPPSNGTAWVHADLVWQVRPIEVSTGYELCSNGCRSQTSDLPPSAIGLKVQVADSPPSVGFFPARAGRFPPGPSASPLAPLPLFAVSLPSPIGRDGP